SSEGDGIVPEVLDEPKDISISSSSSLSGFDAETKDISRVDEIKADENKADKEKATKEQAKEEPPVDKQAGDEQLVDNQAGNKEAGDLEKKGEVLSKFNQAEAIKKSVQANLINEVKNQQPKLIPKSMSDYVKPRLESTVRDML
nr:hypothetical protein [Tanacetum cinerariifolium]